MEPFQSASSEGLEGSVESGLRRKPGPPKKDDPRSEKISCRLTKSEKLIGERYCRQHGITEAKALRLGYLYATAQIEDETNAVTHEILRLIKADKGEHLESHIRAVLKRSALFVVLILIGLLLAKGGTVARYFLHPFDGRGAVWHQGEIFIYHQGEDGYEIRPEK